MNRQFQECVESLKSGLKEYDPTRLEIPPSTEVRWKVALENISKPSRPAPWSGKDGKRLRALVAPADAVFNTSFQSVFVLMPQVEVVGAAANGIEALRLVGELQPDLALLDLYLPGIDGWQAGSVIREFYPAARVIIIGSADTETVRNICLDRYADGFVSRRNYYQELPREISRVLFGLPAPATSEGTAP